MPTLLTVFRSVRCVFQEVLYNQLQDIDNVISSVYDHVYAGRDDGVKKGEVSMLFIHGCAKIY